MNRFLLCALLAFAPAVFATDANTNCDKACFVKDAGTFLGVPYDYSYMDYACRARCLMEKEVAKQTGITSCDLWKANPTTAGPYFASIKALEAANRKGMIRDVHACHARVDLIAKGAAIGGVSMSVWENGLKAAKYIKNFSIVGLVISEGAKHFSHCTCTHSNFRGESGLREDGSPAYDHFWVSMMRADGKWAERHGDAGSKNNITQKTREALKGKSAKTRSGYVASNGPTTTHGICRDRVFYKTGTGGASMTAAFNHARDEGLTHCLFEMENGTSNGAILDRFTYSVWQRNKGWSVRSGARSNKDQIQQEAENGLNGNPDGRDASAYSSSRLTQTELSCHISSSSGGGLQTTEDVLAIYSGTGHQSVERAVKAAKAGGWKGCHFKTHDVAF